ncbi:MAG: SGNH/GDSL hydrolase family protein [Planctomycetales bacterium]|nr:SGNH/GDSL hydrolase family protein [Planctomycetales bacterium]
MGLIFAIMISVASSASAQRKPNPAFADPKIDDRLPNVLLIGDSISIGYMVAARNALEGKANVFRPATNCGPTTKGLEEIDRWIGDRKWDVIHFNFGLHDLKYMGPKGQNLAEPTAADSHQQVPIDEYAANIKTIAERLKKTGAKVIWRETTPVPEGAAGRVPGDSAKYNAAAAKVIAEVGGIEVDPFFEFAESISKDQLPKNVHYTAEGSKKLGEHVAALIEKVISDK